MTDLTPREIVSELDRFIIGQNDAKRAVAVALRNRWRRKQLSDDLRDEVYPKNILKKGSWRMQPSWQEWMCFALVSTWLKVSSGPVYEMLAHCKFGHEGGKPSDGWFSFERAHCVTQARCRQSARSLRRVWSDTYDSS